MVIEFIESKRGQPLLVLNNYKFCIGSVNKSTGLSRWQCITKYCKAKVYTENNALVHDDCEHVIPIHEPYIRPIISRQIVNNVCKRKTVDDTSNKSNKIIVKEIGENVEASQFTTTDIKRLRKNIYEARRKVLPAKPTNLQEVHEFLETIDLKTKQDPTEVFECFIDNFMADRPTNDQVSKYSDYSAENYLTENCDYPPILWASASSSLRRTTNNCESFPIRILIEIFIRNHLQTEVYVKLRSTHLPNVAQDRRGRDRQNRNEQFISQYDFVKEISYNYMSYIHKNIEGLWEMIQNDLEPKIIIGRYYILNYKTEIEPHLQMHYEFQALKINYICLNPRLGGSIVFGFLGNFFKPLGLDEGDPRPLVLAKSRYQFWKHSRIIKVALKIKVILVVGGDFMIKINDKIHNILTNTIHINSYLYSIYIYIYIKNNVQKIKKSAKKLGRRAAVLNHVAQTVAARRAYNGFQIGPA
ncbi:hypothetical protein QTP88_010860 [Uroleucon formosanum]